MKNDDRPRNYRRDTLLAHLGRHPEAQHGAVNPPVYHASTILSANMTEWEARRDPATRRALSVVASGAGSGHGVGLCQTGALGMAKRGTSGEAILAHYYPGATLSRLY